MSMIQQEHFEKISLQKFAGFSQLGPGEMYADPTVTPEGPRSLHFRGNCPIPRLPELASRCARLQAAALRDVAH